MPWVSQSADTQSWKHTASNTDDSFTGLLHSGTAQAATSTTITLDVDSPDAVDDALVGLTCSLDSGAGSSQERTISSYNGTTKVATVSPRWRTNQIKDSNDPSTANWNRTAGGTGSLPVVTPNAGIDPEGNITAARIVFDKGAGTTISDRSDIQPVLSTVTGQPTSSRWWIKSATGTPYDLVFNFNGDTPDFPASQVFTANSEWAPMEIYDTSALDTSRRATLRLRGAQRTSDYADVYVWHAQQENLADLSDYIATTASPVILPNNTTSYSISAGSESWTEQAADSQTWVEQ